MLELGTQVGQYRVLSLLGEGGMGRVYLAEDTVLERRVALKVITDSASPGQRLRERLLREARAASRLSHPNICTIYTAGVWQDEPYIAMQYVDGVPVRPGTSMSTSEIVRIGTGVAEGLAEAHRHGLVHRDVKPQNILVNDRSVVILDFGLARAVNPEPDDVLTSTNLVAGTAPYMSPEQLRGETLDGKTDVFSLGVMLHELLTGRRPFDRGSAVETISAILHEPVPPLALGGRVGAELARLVDRMLAKDPGDRPAAAEVASDLARLQVVSTTEQTAPTALIDSAALQAIAHTTAAVSAGTGTPMVADREAVKLCLRARELWKKRSPIDIRKAMELLHEALELDPEYAPAYAALADCYFYLGFFQLAAPGSVFPKVVAACGRAIELDSRLAQPHATLGWTRTVYLWEPGAAEESFREALRLDLGYGTAHHWYGIFLTVRERFDEARAELRRATELDPLSPIAATACGFPEVLAGNPEKAFSIYRDVIDSEPKFTPARYYLGMAYERYGFVTEAIEQFRAVTEMAETETENHVALAHALAKTGQREEAKLIRARFEQAAKQRFVSPFFYAVIDLGLGDQASALRHLEEALELRAIRLFDLHLDHRFQALRNEPRFQKVLETIGMAP